MSDEPGTVDPAQVDADEKTRQTLTVMAGLAGHFWDVLQAARVPETAACQMLIDWHYACITDGVAWSGDESG